MSKNILRYKLPQLIERREQWIAQEKRYNRKVIKEEKNEENISDKIDKAHKRKENVKKARNKDLDRIHITFMTIDNIHASIKNLEENKDNLKASV